MFKIAAAMFSRRWMLTTLLVLAGSALCVRLGFWQLDRLSQRREFNAHVMEMWTLPPLNLNSGAPLDLTAMEYRAVTVAGSYDFERQVAVRNQYHEGILGYHLLTPLVLDDGTAVLVDRGWIPADGNPAASDWRKYDVHAAVRVDGILRVGQSRPGLGAAADPTLSPGQSRLELWTFLDLERIAQQVPYPLLPVYVQPNVDPTDDQPPIPYQAVLELSEGPHLGYAGQWFVFAAMLFFGYPFIYLRKQEATQ